MFLRQRHRSQFEELPASRNLPLRRTAADAAVGRLKDTKTLHALLAIMYTPRDPARRRGVRLRKGTAADVPGAARFLAEALVTVRRIAPTVTVAVRADSNFHTADELISDAEVPDHCTAFTSRPGNQHVQRQRRLDSAMGRRAQPHPRNASCGADRCRSPASG